jgi:serine/threonine-protein kinase
MSLTSGMQLGAYEILEPLGEGGMGKVYRARDAKLGRDVAIKVVAEGFGHDPERAARFQREAHLLASLNHPHIATVYGLEEANGSHLLVMELVEGETLARRLKSGPLPVPEALSAARQIADALQAAHEKGIIHRDLKPANIAFTADGVVKVLDFGLAKEVETVPQTDLGNSPTITLGATTAGVILGTAAYMAPEQAKGRQADKRSDVWAFGCVLYEMLTSKRAFEGEDVSDTLAAVLRGEPDWVALPVNLAPALILLIQNCLQKDRRDRIADISTAHFLLSNLSHPALDGGSLQTERRLPLWRRVPAAAVSGLFGAAVAVAVVWLSSNPDSPRVSRLEIAPSQGEPIIVNQATRAAAITPDGTRVIYSSVNNTLVVRALDQLQATSLTGLGVSPQGVFVSPDSQWIGFSSDGNRHLKRVPITGGPPIRLAILDGPINGGTWGPDDTIVFSTANQETGLQRIGAGGGEPAVLTRPNRAGGEADHIWPEFLPGGFAILFTVRPMTGNFDDAQIAVLDLRTGSWRMLIQGGTDAHYVSSGHLVYGAGGALRAVAFDLANLAVAGTPVAAVPEVFTHDTGAVDVAVAHDGTMVYVPGSFSADQRTLVWVDRIGRDEPIQGAPTRVTDLVRFSPDGTRVALEVRDERNNENDIWIWDLARDAHTRLTFDPYDDVRPVWAPDGRRILFGSMRDGVNGIFSQAADGTGSVERLTKSPHDQGPSSTDGTRLVFGQTVPTLDIMMVTLDAERRVQPLVQTSFAERRGEISPDGRWLAYESNESGRFEIYVRPFPDVNSGRWQVSTAGGSRPLWAKDNSELFFAAATGALMAVPTERGSPTWKAGTPVKLFDWPTFASVPTSYYASHDGQRFLMIKRLDSSAQTSAPSNLIVVQHFDEELKRLVPKAE